MTRAIAQSKVTKFSSGAHLMDYQKHIRSSFGGQEWKSRKNSGPLKISWFWWNTGEAVAFFIQIR